MAKEWLGVGVRGPAEAMECGDDFLTLAVTGFDICGGLFSPLMRFIDF